MFTNLQVNIFTAQYSVKFIERLFKKDILVRSPKYNKAKSNLNPFLYFAK